MNKAKQEIQEFMKNPEELDALYEGDGVIWVDWREYDEDVVAYFNEAISNKILVQLENHDKEYGDDILLDYQGQSLMIPYEEVMNRDITITWVNHLLMPDYEIRWFMESLGNDTLGYVILSQEDWKSLEAEFGKGTLDYYFLPLQMGMNMFELDFDRVGRILELREKNPSISPQIIMDYVAFEAQEEELKEQKQGGHIELAQYAQESKVIRQQKEKLESQYQIKK